MTRLGGIARDWLARGHAAAVVIIVEAHGSTPREAGATMLVGAEALAGTIGGGQLEFHAIDQARALLHGTATSLALDLPLGPAMGQCCGGRVRLQIARLDEAMLAPLEQRDAALDAARPHVFVFGAGHTGRALAQALAVLPLAVSLIDDRDGVLDGLPDAILCRQLADPAERLADAPRGAAMLAMTHSHALDYRLCEEALRLGHFAYVGMIGSATKRARFLAGLARADAPPATDAFVCPIGGAEVVDKRPEVIAALVAAELLHLFFPAPR
jgi:xanthine dehydrogenase accessory protein XdhC